MTNAVPNQPATSGAEPPSIGYYGVPVIHQPHWKWLIIWYFFLGGIAGSSSCLAAVARLVGGARTAEIARTATYVSILALAPCPVLLIFDLGRPRRFLNMLRTFHITSPMSMGTWALSAFGLFASLSTLLQLISDLERSSRIRKSGSRAGILTARILAVCTGTTGLLVAGYAGVLLAATAVPLWSKRPAILGPLFLSSAMSSGLAAISAAMALRGVPDEHEEAVLHELEAGATIAKGAILTAWLLTLGPTAKPLLHGSLGYVVRHAVVGAGIVAPLLVSATARRLPPSWRRAASVLSSALTLAGVLALRYAVVEGGRKSANDPQATFEMTG
jgi:formate-dependent nitrite reductase membrane component NrfD